MKWSLGVSHSFPLCARHVSTRARTRGDSGMNNVSNEHDGSLLRYIANLDEDGDLPLPTCVDEVTAIEILRRMILLRTFDERALTWHRHGRIGTYAIAWGHEAIHVGATTGVRDSDWLLPSYRDSLVGLMRGMSPTTVLAWWRGQPQGAYDPRRYRVGSISIPVASHVPHAAGVAWGERMQGRSTVAVAFFGDGATSEGDFHEGINFAAVLNLPVILMCNNNQWAITTPIDKQTRARTLADKGPGYGVRAVRVDGNDVLAVLAATHEAAERGRAGEGPTFIEAVSYRPGLHATADDPTRYRDESLAEPWRRNNCLARYEQYMCRLGLVDPTRIAELHEQALQTMAEAIREVEALPRGGAEDVFDTVYDRPPTWFGRDLVEAGLSRRPRQTGEVS